MILKIMKMTMMKTIPHCDSCDDEEGDDAYMYILPT